MIVWPGPAGLPGDRGDSHQGLPSVNQPVIRTTTDYQTYPEDDTLSPGPLSLSRYVPEDL